MPLGHGECFLQYYSGRGELLQDHLRGYRSILSGLVHNFSLKTGSRFKVWAGPNLFDNRPQYASEAAMSAEQCADLRWLLQSGLMSICSDTMLISNGARRFCAIL